MTASPCAQPALRDYHPAQRLLVDDVLQGLQRSPKRLAPMYLYDERGSHLFDRICELPEYYLTRAETRILDSRGEEISGCIGAQALLVEFGSGASHKTRLVLDRLQQPSAYVPVDISRSHLLAAARSICASYPDLEVLPVCADFTQPFTLPRPAHAAARTVVFFPGSTIGNFEPRAAQQLLQLMRRVAGPHGGLLIGVDLTRDAAILGRAYDDAAGVTAAFNINVLQRLNSEFGANFDAHFFRHAAVWSHEHSRIEMHLVSQRRQTVRLAGETIAFAAGEALVTEHCHKYTRAGFEALARPAGWTGRQMWQDERRQFSVHYLEATP